jgi:hypothetical protein
VFIKKIETKVILSNIIYFKSNRVRIIVIILLNILIEYVILLTISISFLLARRLNIK